MAMTPERRKESGSNDVDVHTDGARGTETAKGWKCSGRRGQVRRTGFAKAFLQRAGRERVGVAKLLKAHDPAVSRARTPSRAHCRVTIRPAIAHKRVARARAVPVDRDAVHKDNNARQDLHLELFDEERRDLDVDADELGGEVATSNRLYRYTRRRLGVSG